MTSSIYIILQKILSEHQDLLRKLPEKLYTQPVPSLDGSTVGAHTRHILEFFEILMSGYFTNRINYDKRKRNFELEIKPEKALESISKILAGICLPNKDLVLEQTAGKICLEIPTNFHRELLYNIEHCIHHQALIKVAFNDMMMNQLLNKNFGVAPSTIDYREAQNIN